MNFSFKEIFPPRFYSQIYCLCLFSLFNCNLQAQVDSSVSLRFDFNEHSFKEATNQVLIKPVGVTLTEDRFGNKKSAAYVHGHATSYINLGTSELLKPKRGTISMWVKMENVVIAGKGFNGNPFIIIRNGPGEDFNMAYGIGYSPVPNRLGVQQTRDSIKEVMVFSRDTAEMGKWYHVLVTSDDRYLALYINGELEDKQIKGFETTFLKGDSVIIGRTTGTKNERYTQAIFDDISIFHRVLSDQEIQALYHEPNPNRVKTILYEFMRYGLIILALIITIVFLLFQNKKKLRKQREHFELENKVNELEIKVIKTQMNPHFISNSLAAIQNFIYTGQSEKAGEYLEKFSHFLRQILEYSDKTYLALEEELSVIKFIIELEQLRFKNNFQFILDIENGIPVHDILIPSLITQPFIENAIWHGLLPLKTRDPKLTIRVYSENDNHFIAIEDNGVGRSSAKTSNGKKSRGTKLASDKIDSINRLKSSSKYKLEIIDLLDEKNSPAGTKVVIQLSHPTADE